jgi:hypothetical protein
MHDCSARAWECLQRSLILVLFLSLCLYSPTLFHDAFADDDIYLAYANRFLREAEWSDLYRLFLAPANPWEYLPVRDFTYWLDFRIYGDEPAGFHATNLIWYLACGLALFYLLRQLVLLCRPDWARRAAPLALAGVLIFMVHPAHVEVVAWIASRKDLVAGTLGFVSLAFSVYAIRHTWSRSAMILSAMLLFAACFSKASAMSFVVIVSVFVGMRWCTSENVSRNRKTAFLLLFWAMLGAIFYIHLCIGEATGIRIENHPGLFVMLERASRIFSALIGILLFPYHLRFYYDVYLLGDWHWFVSASAAALLCLSLRVLWQRYSLWALGVVFALCPLLIYLQLMPFTTWSLASERFVFVSVAGLALILVDVLGRITRPAIIAALLVLIASPPAMLVWARIDDWSESRNLLLREYQLQPDFHNAIRDRIVLTLLPEQRYAEAAELAGKIQRPYAEGILLSLIATEQAYREMTEVAQASDKMNSGFPQQVFCNAVVKLQSAKLKAYEYILTEPDVSYNNILRTIDTQLKQRYGASKKICGHDG